MKTLQRLGYTREDMTEDDLHRHRSIEQYNYAAAALQRHRERVEEHDRIWNVERFGGPMSCFRQICIGVQCGSISVLLGMVGLIIIDVAMSRGTQLTLNHFIPLLIILGLGFCTVLQVYAPNLGYLPPRPDCLDGFRVLICGYSDLPWNVMRCNLFIPWIEYLHHPFPNIRRMLFLGSLAMCISGLLFILKLLDADEIRHAPEDPKTYLDGLSFTGICGIFSAGFLVQWVSYVKNEIGSTVNDYVS